MPSERDNTCSLHRSNIPADVLPAPSPLAATVADRDYIAKEVRREVAKRLLTLKRYDAGTADEGDGYMYDYADESKTGQWVEWDDIEKIVDELSS
jgi:hypothetical protein